MWEENSLCMLVTPLFYQSHYPSGYISYGLWKAAVNLRMLDLKIATGRDHLQVSHIGGEGGGAQVDEVTWRRSAGWLETEPALKPEHLVS